MANSNLTNARKAKNDEFYTQYNDIQKEIEAFLEFNPYAFRGKQFLCLVTTLNGATLHNFSYRILNDLELKS